MHKRKATQTYWRLSDDGSGYDLKENRTQSTVSVARAQPTEPLSH